MLATFIIIACIIYFWNIKFCILTTKIFWSLELALSEPSWSLYRKGRIYCWYRRCISRVPRPTPRLSIHTTPAAFTEMQNKKAKRSKASIFLWIMQAFKTTPPTLHQENQQTKQKNRSTCTYLVLIMYLNHMCAYLYTLCTLYSFFITCTQVSHTCLLSLHSWVCTDNVFHQNSPS